MRTGEAAADYAQSRIGSNAMPDDGLCLQMTRQNYPVDSYYYSAIDAWNAAQYPHPDDRNIPVGVPVWFWSDSVYRHVAIHVGDGNFHVTTFNDDIRQYSMADMENIYGPYLGWAEDLNRVTVWTGESGTATIGDVDMFIIQRNTTNGTILIVGAGWSRALNGAEKGAYVAAGVPFKVLPTDQYDAISRAVSGGIFSATLTNVVTGVVAPVKDRTDRYLDAKVSSVLAAVQPDADPLTEG